MKKVLREKTIKTIIYRIYSAIVVFLVMLLVTRNIETATNFTLFIEIIKMVSYFIFELIWDK